MRGSGSGLGGGGEGGVLTEAKAAASGRESEAASTRAMLRPDDLLLVQTTSRACDYLLRRCSSPSDRVCLRLFFK